jgi:hypothetical protein
MNLPGLRFHALKERDRGRYAVGERQLAAFAAVAYLLAQAPSVRTAVSILRVVTVAQR